MKARMPYVDINHTLKSLKGQVVDGLPFALNECPKFNTPEELFYWLKPKTRYKKDPDGIELLQSLPTLLGEGNYHGEKGRGDCDCFTIAALTLLVANGFENLYVILVGRNRFTPVHIYCGLLDEKGVFRILDLTNRLFDTERPYPFKQHLPFRVKF
jgi:hypothetical protein